MLTQAPYNYVGDNPLNGTDPTGLCGWNPFGSDSCIGDAAGVVGGAIGSAASWAVNHPGVIAGGLGLAAATVATGGAALALGGAAIGLTVGQGVEDAANHDYLGVALDVASLVPGLGAEFETYRAGALDGAALEEWARSGANGLKDTVGIWNAARGAEGWGSALGRTSAGLGFLGGAYTLSSVEAMAAGGC